MFQERDTAGTQASIVDFFDSYWEALAALGWRAVILHSWQDLPEKIESDIDYAVEGVTSRELLDFLARFSREKGWRLVQVIEHEPSAFYCVCMQGWSIFQHGRWRVLITRFEDINKNYIDAINAYLIERFGPDTACDGLRSANLSEEKWYSDLMREFKAQVTFTPGEIEELYSSQYCRHFYTDTESEEMKSKWKIVER